MSRLTWWNHLIHIGIRCLDSIEPGFFTHSFQIDIHAMRVSSLTIACLPVRRDERERMDPFVFYRVTAIQLYRSCSRNMPF